MRLMSFQGVPSPRRRKRKNAEKKHLEKKNPPSGCSGGRGSWVSLRSVRRSAGRCRHRANMGQGRHTGHLWLMLALTPVPLDGFSGQTCSIVDAHGCCRWVSQSNAASAQHTHFVHDFSEAGYFWCGSSNRCTHGNRRQAAHTTRRRSPYRPPPPRQAGMSARMA